MDECLQIHYHKRLKYAQRGKRSSSLTFIRFFSAVSYQRPLFQYVCPVDAESADQRRDVSSERVEGGVLSCLINGGWHPGSESLHSHVCCSTPTLNVPIKVSPILLQLGLSILKMPALLLLLLFFIILICILVKMPSAVQPPTKFCDGENGLLRCCFLFF